MRAFLIALSAFVVAIVCAALIAPSFVDWNARRDDLGRRIGAILGIDVEITGDMTASLLPSPHFEISQVRLAPRPEGAARGDDEARIGQMEVRVATGPLLSGRVVVERVTLSDVRANWTVDADGRSAWDGLSERMATPPESLNFENVEIRRASLIRRDARDGSAHRFEMSEGRLAADSPLGPYHVTGAIAVDGVEFQGELTTGRFARGIAAPVRLNLAQPGGDASLRVAGIITADAEGRRRFSGEARAEGGNLAAASLPILAAIDDRALPPKALDRPFSIKASVEATTTRVVFDDVDARLGEDAATGAIAFDLDGPTPSARAILAVSRIDLDAWNAGAGGVRLPSPPAGINGGVELTIDALTRRGGAARRVRLDARLVDGTLFVDRLAALMPGGADLSASGTLRVADGGPRLDARLELNADNLRSTLDWAGLDGSAVPADRLRRVSLATTLRATPERLEASELDVRLDTSRVEGGFTVTRGSRPSIGIRLGVDRLNLDAYLPDPTAFVERARAALAGVDLGLDLTVHDADAGGVGIKDARLSLVAANGNVDLREASAADVQGSRVRVFGHPPLSADGPIDLSIEASGPTPAPLVRLFPAVGTALPDLEPIGAYTLRARAVGAARRFEFETAIEGAGGSLATGGTFDATARGGSPTLDLRARLIHPDAADLWRRLSDARPVPGSLGACDLYARIESLDGGWRVSEARGTLGGTAVAAALTLTRSRGRAAVDGEVRLGDVDLDRLRGVPRGALGIEPALLAAKALSDIGGSIAVSASSLILSGVRLEDATARLRLDETGAHVEEARGSLLGGRFAGSLGVTIGERPEMEIAAEIAGARPDTLPLPGGISVRSASIDLKARARLAPTSSGGVRPLDGDGWFALRDGTIPGVEPRGLSLDPNERVAFSSAGGRIRVENGALVSDDLNLVWASGVARAKGAFDPTGDAIDLAVRVDHRDGSGQPAGAFRVTGPTSGPRRIVEAAPPAPGPSGGSPNDVIRGLLENLRR